MGLTKEEMEILGNAQEVIRQKIRILSAQLHVGLPALSNLVGEEIHRFAQKHGERRGDYTHGHNHIATLTEYINDMLDALEIQLGDSFRTRKATHTYKMVQAYVDAGFTKEEALQLLSK